MWRCFSTCRYKSIQSDMFYITWLFCCPLNSLMSFPEFWLVHNTIPQNIHSFEKGSIRKVDEEENLVEAGTEASTSESEACLSFHSSIRVSHYRNRDFLGRSECRWSSEYVMTKDSYYHRSILVSTRNIRHVAGVMLQ